MDRNQFFRVSTVTGKSYDVFKTVKILNVSQAAFYMSMGVELRDIKLSTDKKDGTPVLVFYFYKNETRNAYDIWCSRKSDKND